MANYCPQYGVILVLYRVSAQIYLYPTLDVLITSQSEAKYSILESQLLRVQAKSGLFHSDILFIPFKIARLYSFSNGILSENSKTFLFIWNANDMSTMAIIIWIPLVACRISSCVMPETDASLAFAPKIFVPGHFSIQSHVLAVLN